MGMLVTIDQPVTIENTKQLAKDRIEEEFKKYKENHAAWASDFLSAERQRRVEEQQWREFYYEVYKQETAWWKSTLLFALNGIQLWALFTQYRQQKEIANRTYDLANRQLSLAEQMYSYYKDMFQPHETDLGQQIDRYFADPYKPQYEITSGRFVLNARMQMVGKRREALMCASQYCTGALANNLKQIALQEANLVANAMNTGVKYERLREHKIKWKWLQTRLTFIQAGRGVAAQGITGIDGAVKAFHSFGADPGSALSRLLNSIAYTIGGIIPNPTEKPAPVVEAQPTWTRPQPRPSTSAGKYATL